jgi:hypothetical protein
MKLSGNKILITGEQPGSDQDWRSDSYRKITR